MEKLDREYQLRILQAAADVYPQQLLVHGELLGRSGAEIEINCAYLEEHKFVELSWVGSPNSGRVVVSVAATAAGIDYLKNDGGVKAILNVLTVRLETDTVKEIFIERARSANGDRTAKDPLVEQIKMLSAERLKEMTKTALSAGLTSLPNSLSLVETWAREPVRSPY
jgi:hypothetical protein